MPPVEPSSSWDADIFIAGAGPVGLLLANLLGRRGAKVRIAERRRQPGTGSMAIGITPPSLALLATLGLDQSFVRNGVPVVTARVFEDGKELGEVDFSRIPAEHRFILSLPQAGTVELLREGLRACPNVVLMEGAEATDLQSVPGGVRVEVRDPDGSKTDLFRARWLVGCDGHRSRVRERAGIRYRGGAYRARFIMADFQDHTAMGDEAHLYFGPRGSVESFPLPEGRRRWVVQTGIDEASPSAALTSTLVDRVRDVTGLDLSGEAPLFESAFQPARRIADAFVRDHTVLCGDAAHVMSPIGGQGMNTGFADAAHLDRVLFEALEDPARASLGLAEYQRARRRAFRVAASRAARGMWLGTCAGSVNSALRRVFIEQVLLKPPVRDRVAPYFAMLTIPGTFNPATAPGR